MLQHIGQMLTSKYTKARVFMFHTTWEQAHISGHPHEWTKIQFQMPPNLYLLAEGI